MKVAHEAPMSIMKEIRNHTDYDYALPHLLDEYKEYAEFFNESKELGRYIILDNSLAELGEAYNFDRLKYWVQELKPNEFIVPDVWEDANATLAQAKYWMSWYKDNQEHLEGVELMAVVQAKRYSEAINCYVLLKEMGYKKIAFSYGAKYYADIVGHPNEALGKALGRIRVITGLIQEEIIEENDRIHLLGCSVPQEFGWYKGIKQIETIDTSNPVMAGLEKVSYTAYGLDFKPKTNLNSHFDSEIDPQALDCILNNVWAFKIINGLTDE